MEVACYLSDWVSRRSASLAPRTVECYKSVIRLHIAPALAGVDLAWCRPDLLRQLVAGLLAVGRERSAQLVVVLLRAALACAVSDGLLAASPAEGLAVPHHDTAPARYWDVDQIQAFVGSCRSRWRVAWLLALACGLRRGELAGLRWTDVDLRRSEIHVTNQRQRLPGVGVIDCPPKSKAGIRVIPLPSALAEALRAEYARQRAAIDRGAVLPAYVVCYADNRGIDPHVLNRALAADVAAAGVPSINLHGLRHTMATAAISSDVSMKVLQQLLGHAHYSTTADIYAHVVDRKARQAIDIVSSCIFAPSQGAMCT